MKVPYDEAVTETRFDIDNRIGETLFALRPDSVAVIYPHSMMDSVLEGELLRV